MAIAGVHIVVRKLHCGLVQVLPTVLSASDVIVFARQLVQAVLGVMVPGADAVIIAMGE